MRIDPGKGWPHPVLRPPEYGDDYPNAEFEVDIDPKLAPGSVAVDLTAVFELSDPDLLQLAGKGAAEYVLLVKSPKTHFRREYRSAAPRIKTSFRGELSGRVEFSAFLVCVELQRNFVAQGWHPDFAGLSFDLLPGVVLAEDKPKECWIDAADEAPLGTIFQVRAGRVADGRWDCNMESGRVQILLSEADYNRFRSAREQANNTPEGQYLMNGLYLPVLIHVLNEADKSRDTFEDYRWFDSLNHRLEAVGCEPLGSTSANRAMDAQKALEFPFAKMPVIAEQGADS